MGPAGRGPRGPRGGQTGGEVPARTGRAGLSGGRRPQGRAEGLRSCQGEVGAPGCGAEGPAHRGRGWGAGSTRRAWRCLTCDLGQVARSLELERTGFEFWDYQLSHSVTLGKLFRLS